MDILKTITKDVFNPCLNGKAVYIHGLVNDKVVEEVFLVNGVSDNELRLVDKTGGLTILQREEVVWNPSLYIKVLEVH